MSTFERKLAAQKGVQTRRRNLRKMARAALAAKPEPKVRRPCPYCGASTFGLACYAHSDLPELDGEEAKG